MVMVFCVITVYCNEVFPTLFRGIGVAIALGLGRLGAIIAPIITNWLLNIDIFP